jgi:hypothetical protein
MITFSSQGGKIKSAFFRCEALQLLSHALKFRPMCVGEAGKRDDELLASLASQLWACFRCNLGLMLGSEADVSADAVGKKDSAKWLAMAQGMHKTARRRQVVQYGVNLCKVLKKCEVVPKPALDLATFVDEAERVIAAGDNVAAVVNSMFQLKSTVDELNTAGGSENKSRGSKKRKAAVVEAEVEAEVAPAKGPSKIAATPKTKGKSPNKKTKVDAAEQSNVSTDDKKLAKSAKKTNKRQLSEKEEEAVATSATPVKAVKSAKKGKKSAKKSAKK